MARLLRTVACLASERAMYNPTFNFDPTNFDPTKYQGITTTAFAIPGSLTLQLANRCDEVILEGQATFVFTATDSVAATDSFSVQINVYSNGVLAYSTTSLITGLTLISGQKYIWTVPVQLIDRPSLTSVQDTVVYTGTIVSLASDTAKGSISLVQGSVVAEEVSSDNNCFPVCGFIPRTTTTV